MFVGGADAGVCLGDEFGELSDVFCTSTTAGEDDAGEQVFVVAREFDFVGYLFEDDLYTGFDDAGKGFHRDFA